MLLFGEATNPSNGFYEASAQNGFPVTLASSTVATGGAIWACSLGGARSDLAEGRLPNNVCSRRRRCCRGRYADVRLTLPPAEGFA